MAKRFSGVVNIDVTKSLPDWGPYTQPIVDLAAEARMALLRD